MEVSNGIDNAQASVYSLGHQHVRAEYSRNTSLHSLLNLTVSFFFLQSFWLLALTPSNAITKMNHRYPGGAEGVPLCISDPNELAITGKHT